MGRLRTGLAHTWLSKRSLSWLLLLLVLLPGLAIGAAGGILALANIAPAECCEVWRLARA